MAKDFLEKLGLRAPDTDEFTVDDLIDGDEANVSEIIDATTRVWDGDFLHVDRVDVTLPNGHAASRDILRHPGAVGIIAIDDENRILLVDQYRTALERVTMEIPAGKLDAGEEIEECARRELEEETGYTAGRLAYLIPVAPAAGYSDELLHLFMATDLSAGIAHPDSDEFVNVHWLPLADLVDLVLDGRIEDSKTIIAALVCDAIAHRM